MIPKTTAKKTLTIPYQAEVFISGFRPCLQFSRHGVSSVNVPMKPRQEQLDRMKSFVSELADAVALGRPSPAMPSMAYTELKRGTPPGGYKENNALA
jgi:hypothetical protein